MSTDFRRAARPVAEAFVRAAVGQIPVVGWALTGLWDAVEAARTAARGNGPMTREDVIALIRSLPQAEYEQIVDRELAVAEGGVQQLGPAELLAVRRQLVELPATLASLLTEVRQRDADARGVRVAELRDELAASLRSQDWHRAHRAARRMRRQGVDTGELEEIERYAYGRHVHPVRVAYIGIVGTMSFVVVTFIVRVLTAVNAASVNTSIAFLAVMALLAWFSTSKRFTARTRSVFVVISVVYLGIWCAALAANA